MSLRHLFTGLALLGVSIALAGPLKYTVSKKDAKDGTYSKVGTYVDELTGDDKEGYVDESTLTLDSEGHKTTIHEIEHYGKDGVVTTKSVELALEGHELKLKALLSETGAKVTAWHDDDKDEKEIALASKTDRADPTNFWFKSIHPKEGDSVTYQSFDMQEMKWSDVHIVYVGKKKIKIGDKELDAFQVDRTEGESKSTIYVDDNGDTLVVEEEDMRIERDLG